jgi:tRNA (guanine26-N2/guanine27-N2)-dimethyltransferase
MLNREISVCTPLAGCGVRGIRFATEVEGVKKVVINDINVKAFQLASYNVRMNGLSERVVVKNEDANFLLASYGAPRKRFDAIDIDPFGPPVPYLDSAIRALRNGGLLILTATDMAPLCGVHPKACIRKYGGKPLRTEYCHELAVRLLAGCLAMTAAKYEMGISIIFSHSTDHYIRIYAIAKHGAKKADENIKKTGYILHCFKCLHREPVKGLFLIKDSAKCCECGSKMEMAGPLWLGEIIDAKFCWLMENVVAQKPLRQGWKIRRLLASAKSEAKASTTYYVLDKICKKLALPVPSVEKVVDGLKKRGFQAVPTHFNVKGIKSNAPLHVIERAIKEALAI